MLKYIQNYKSPTGGKIVCFQGSVPNVGEGALKPKQDGNKSLLDSPLMSASNPFYKNFAGECTKSQVCADMFIFGSSNSDVATLSKFYYIKREFCIHVAFY